MTKSKNLHIFYNNLFPLKVISFSFTEILKLKFVMLQRKEMFHSDSLGYINIFSLTVVDSLEQLNIMKF